MKNAKYQWNTFQPYDFRGVEAHLAAMAAKGWRLERARGSLWKYRRAEPAQVRYAVTYSGSASQFEPGPTEEEQSLEELCAAAGWTKVSDCLQMQIFSTEDPNAVPLETDENLRLENIHRCMWRSLIPGTIAILLLFLFIGRDFFPALVTWDLYGMLKSNALLVAGFLCLIEVLLQIYTLAAYFLWRRRSRRSVEDGGPCLPVSRGVRWANLGIWVPLVLLVAAFLLSELDRGHRGTVLYFAAYMALFTLIIVLTRATSALLRKRGASKTSNMTWTLAVDVVLCFALLGGLAWARYEIGWFSDERPTEDAYEYRGELWDLSPRQDFPLTLAELTGEEYGHIRREAEDLGSVFIPRRSFRETALLGDGPKVCGLSYTLWELSSPALRESLLEDLLEDDPLKFRGMTLVTLRYVPEDPAPWGAEAAYRRYQDENPNNSWLLVWPGQAAAVSLDDAPTEAQKALISARLAPEDWKEETR